jgi:hypothetical protein
LTVATRKKAKRKMTPWGRLRIQAGTAGRHGDHKKAKKLRAEADRLEKAAGNTGKGKASRKTAGAGQRKGMAAAVKHIEATSNSLGLTPQQTVDVFRAGIRVTLSKGLDR